MSVYDLSWSTSSFLSKLKLWREAHKEARPCLRSTNPELQAVGYSLLSSTYYSIAGSGFAALKAAIKPRLLAPVRIAAWPLTWLPLALWCHWRMLHLSNKVVRLIGYGEMTADQCDIRQSILRHRKFYTKAAMCIRLALTKEPIQAYTRGLLHISLAEIQRRRGNILEARLEIDDALHWARKAERDDMRQVARIYRRAARVTDSMHPNDKAPGRELRRKAMRFAEATGSKDQILKLQ